MKRERVLFICTKNSARSPMAEAWLNRLCGDAFEAESAGFEAGALNPFVVQAMAEVDIDISGKKPQALFDVVRAGQPYRFVISVCDKSAAERCPIFPGVTTRLDWSFPDPSAIEGADDEKLQTARNVRDMIRERIVAWCGEMCPIGEEQEVLT